MLLGLFGMLQGSKIYSLQVYLVMVSFRVWNRKIMYMYCITIKPCLEFIGEKRSSGGLRCNEDDEVDVHSLLHWLSFGNKTACFYG